MDNADQRAVILYGAPASGKNTITTALAQHDSRYRLYPRLKCGPGRTAGYRMLTRAQLAVLRARPSAIIWQNRRYGAVYLVDRELLAAMAAAGLIPILHLGQVAAIAAIRSALPQIHLLVVSLTCPREVAAQRITARATGDADARLAAYDATEPLPAADLTLDTSTSTPQHAAARIDALLTAR